MGEASSNSDPTLPPREGESEATQPWPAKPVQPPDQPPTYVPPRPPPTYVPPRQPPTYVPPPQPTVEPPRWPGADAPRQPPTIITPRQPPAGAVPYEPTMVPHEPTMVPHEPTMVSHEPTMYAPLPESPAAAGRLQAPDAAAPQPPAPEVVRYGPGVPASQAAVSAGQAGAAAENVWRSGHRAEPPPGRAKLRRRLGLLLTVILLVAAGVVAYLRFFDHPSLQVTGVEMLRPTTTGCTVDVTGRINTNGGAGTVSYQWVFQPQTQAPERLNQSLTAGQHAANVTIAVEGQGHGTVSQLVTLDVLSPGTGRASTTVTISC